MDHTCVADPCPACGVGSVDAAHLRLAATADEARRMLALCGRVYDDLLATMAGAEVALANLREALAAIHEKADAWSAPRCVLRPVCAAPVCVGAVSRSRPSRRNVGPNPGNASSSGPTSCAGRAGVASGAGLVPTTSTRCCRAVGVGTTSTPTSV